MESPTNLCYKMLLRGDFKLWVMGLDLTPLIFRSKKLAKMVRKNQMAPLPPSRGKDCSDDTLSLLIMFDDLKRNGKVSNIL